MAFRFLGEDDQAEKAFGKASWARVWFSASKYELALLSCRRGDFARALDHLHSGGSEILQNNLAAVLLASSNEAHLAKTKQRIEENRPEEILKEIVVRDPLDHWANYELARREPDFSKFLRQCRNDAQTILDLAFNYIEAGLYQRAIELLKLHKASPVVERARPNPAAKTLTGDLRLGWMYATLEHPQLSASWLQRAQAA